MKLFQLLQLFKLGWMGWTGWTGWLEWMGLVWVLKTKASQQEQLNPFLDHAAAQLVKKEILS